MKGKEAAIEGKKGKQADSKPAAHMGTVTEAPKEDGGQDDDNPDARTVFVRNVPAEATQALMREVRHAPSVRRVTSPWVERAAEKTKLRRTRLRPGSAEGHPDAPQR